MMGSVRGILRDNVGRSALLIAMVLGSQPALAQGAAAEADAAAAEDTGVMIVTGSRIARRDVESSSPIQIIDSKALDTRGFSTLAEALNEQPAFGIPGASPVGFGQSSFGAGQSFVNFLGLGSQRTLTLVNGRRFVSSNTGSVFGPTGSGGSQVDLNTIPTKMIDRVETVAAIGAPIYGSDAIAGTINIILKKDFEGIDVDGQYGGATRGDAPNWRLRALVGKNFAGGRGNITLGGEYSKSKGLLFNQRQVTISDDRFDDAPAGGSPFARVPYRDFRVPSIATSGVPLVGDFISTSPQQSNVFFGDPSLNFGVNGANNSQLKFDNAGNLIPIDFGSTIGRDDAFSLFTSGGNGYRLTDVENLVTDLERWNATATASYEISDKVRLFAEGWYSVSQGRNLASQPTYQYAFFDAAGNPDGNLIIPLSNPFLSAATRTAIQDSINNNPLSDQNLIGEGFVQDYFYLGRANFDLSPGVSTGRVQVLRGVFGLEGSYELFKGREWNFGISLTYGTSTTSSRNPELVQQNFVNALNAVRNESGTIVCAPGYTNAPIATLSSTCAPLNPFGNQVSDAARAYVTTIATPRNLNSQTDFLVTTSGPVATLPGGDLAVLLGYEHREETSRFDPGTFYFGSGSGDSSQRGQYGRSTPIDPVYGKFITNEIFGELNADIISPKNDVKFVHELSVNSSARYIWNTLAGGDLTWTVGGRYAPVAGLTFRGAFTRAVRAPSVTEAFNPRSSGFFFATDPCDQTQITRGPDPSTRAANCAAAGVPAGFNSLSDQRSFRGFTFGNPFLQNEKSNSFTLGMVLAPKAIPGLTATVDYVSVRLSNAISQFSATQVVSACYDSVNFPDNPFCSLVQRDEDFQISSVGTTFFNSANLRYKGILAAVNYRTATPFLGADSHVMLGVSYQYLDTLTEQVTAGAVPLVKDNTPGYSRHKGVFTFNYDNGPFNYQAQVQYIGSANGDNNAPANFYSINRINEVAFVNMSVSYDITKMITLRASVDNIFDAKPPSPFPVIGTTNTADGSNSLNTYFPGVIGTFVRVGMGVHF
ncbi:TonB-dependent receptor domain-containing protein [Sandarakinorhabdus oryzae]|uniref:TonB-dependent receptor domain-containing protein n=1 Tax=Sandarakinorhabdus oryzae TaxID=2675220 RepID=UPI0018CC4B18|nr:TonB-dependent receptor [Sandarakinorhabdus oryzae]